MPLTETICDFVVIEGNAQEPQDLGHLAHQVGHHVLIVKHQNLRE